MNFSENAQKQIFQATLIGAAGKKICTKSRRKRNVETVSVLRRDGRNESESDDAECTGIL